MMTTEEFKATFGAKNLKKIYLEKVKASGAIGIDRVRPDKLEALLNEEIATIIRKTDDGSYKFTAYKEKLISKGRGAYPRVISIPTARDRIVLRALCDFLSEVFKETSPCLPQAVIDSLQSALKTGKYGDYAKIDLKSFYPSIPQDRLLIAISKRVKEPKIIALIKSAIETPTVPERKGKKGSSLNKEGVPQGLAISNILAEIYLKDVDAQHEEDPAIWYKRYVDDILILAQEDRGEIAAKKVIKSLEDLGLSPHPLDEPESKTKVGSLCKSVSFLGYEINDSTITIRKESIHKFEASLASIFTAYHHRSIRTPDKTTEKKEKKEASRNIQVCKWRLNLRITGCIFQGRRLGWIFYFSQINNTSRLRGVEKTVQTLLERFKLDEAIHPKSLIKTYYESKRKDKNSHKYIPNFDLTPVPEQRKILSLLLGARRIKGLSDERIEELFKMRISVAVRELEADLTGTS